MTDLQPAHPGWAPLDRLLAAGPWAIDGGLASELEARGHDLTGSLWSARLLRDDPEALVGVHRAYFEAGAAVAISASYQASRAGFAAAGLDAAEADVLLARSVELARLARDEADAVLGPLGGGDGARVGALGAAGGQGPAGGAGGQGQVGGARRLVAASVGPYGATLHDGSEYRGRYGVARAALLAFHRERLEVLVAAGPDLLAVETIPDADEAEVLVEALADHPGVPAWLSFSCADAGHVCAGQPVAEAAAVAASAPSVRAVGVNCTAPEHVAGVLDGLAAGARAAGREGLPLVAYPNAGRTWDAAGECWVGEGASVLPGAVVADWVACGALLVGGCCGLGPDAITTTAAALAPLRPAP